MKTRKTTTLLFCCCLWPAILLGQTGSLLEAARSDDLVALERLLAGGADANARAGDGAVALHWAAHRGNRQAVALLLGSGADPNASNELGATALWLAALNSDAGISELLLSGGADPNLALRGGESPLMTAARGGDRSTVAALLAHGAEVDARETEHGQTALMWAAAQGHSEVLQQLLDAGADRQLRSRVWRQYENTAGNTNPSGNFAMAHGGSTALLFVARNGDLASARVLLDSGADVNVSNAAGVSALVLAAHSGHGELGRFLLERGADPDVADAGYTALHAAVRRGLTDLVVALLDAGADIDTPISQGTPGRRFSADYSIRAQLIGRDALWLAAKYGEVAIVRELLSRGADPHTVSGRGVTLLQVAMGNSGSYLEHRGDRIGNEVPDKAEEERRTQELAQIFLDLGVDVNAADERGWTALHHAVIKDFPAVVEYLLLRGATPAATTDRGATALSLAETEQTIPGSNGLRGTRPEVAALLRRMEGSP